MTANLDNVKGFLLDMDGTLYLGERAIDGARVFLAAARSLGCRVLCLTNNSSRDAGMYYEKMQRLGLPVSQDEILTSGDATAMYVAGQLGRGKSLHVAGTAALRRVFREAGFTVTRNNPQAVVLGFDTTLTYASMRRLCDLVRAGLPYYATHPDYNCPTEQGPIPDIGAMIAFVKASTGREPDAVIGKPNRFIAEAAAARMGLPLENLAVVGDRLYTDIAMGLGLGIPAVLVLSGETSRQDLALSSWQPDYVFENIGELAVLMKNTAHSHNGDKNE